MLACQGVSGNPYIIVLVGFYGFGLILVLSQLLKVRGDGWMASVIEPSEISAPGL